MEDTTNKTLSQIVREFIKEKRIALGMSQEQFAVLIFKDVTKQGYLCRIENGSREITVNTLEKICKALNSEVQILEH